MGIQHAGGTLAWPTDDDYRVTDAAVSDPCSAEPVSPQGTPWNGVVSREVDTIPGNQSAADSCGNRLTVLFHRELGTVEEGDADAVRFTMASGAKVFASGSHQFVWGLGRHPGGREDASWTREHQAPGVQVRLMLDDMLASRYVPNSGFSGFVGVVGVVESVGSVTVTVLGGRCKPVLGAGLLNVAMTVRPSARLTRSRLKARASARRSTRSRFFPFPDPDGERVVCCAARLRADLGPLELEPSVPVGEIVVTHVDRGCAERKSRQAEDRCRAVIAGVEIDGSQRRPWRRLLLRRFSRRLLRTGRPLERGCLWGVLVRWRRAAATPPRGGRARARRQAR